MVTVSGILTTHAEGDILQASFNSMLAAMVNLEESGRTGEIIVVMDRPNNNTRKSVSRCLENHECEVIELNYGDQGKVRNHMSNLASGKYIAFLDGDDLWSENWLSEACVQMDEIGGRAVVYPEFNWFFEGSDNILCKSDQDSEWFDYEALRAVNLWDALCLCPRDVYLDIPFVSRKIDQGFAYEDWQWNRRVFEHGIKQKVAKNTIIFKRRRGGSQGEEASKRGVMAEPTPSVYYDF